MNLRSLWIPGVRRPARPRRGTPRASLRCLVAERLEAREVFNVHFQFDYSLDAAGFFNDPARRSVLEQAASVLGNRLADGLQAITPAGGNTWTAQITDPATGQLRSIDNPAIPADTLRVYVGGRDLGNATLGQGGPGGFSANGDNAWLQTVRARGQSGALAATPTDFGPWGGAISFDIDSSWHFGATTAGLTGSRSDFYTVALHELMHVVGFGVAGSFTRYVVNSGGSKSFAGPAAMAAYAQPGSPVPLNSDGTHWLDGLNDGGINSIVDPSVESGVRKQLRSIDLGALADIGWSVTPNTRPGFTGTASITLPSTQEPISPSDVATITIRQLLEQLGAIDPDNDTLGIAVTAVAAAQPGWESSSGGSYTTIDVSQGPVLLTPDMTIRYWPGAHQFGSAQLTFRVWDGSVGEIPSNGVALDLNATAFSSQTATLGVTLTPVADAPRISLPPNAPEDQLSAANLIINRNLADGAEVTHFRIDDVQNMNLFLADGVTPVLAGTFIAAEQGAAGLRFKSFPNEFGLGVITVSAATSASAQGIGRGSTTDSVFLYPVNDAPSFQKGATLNVQPGVSQVVPWAKSITPGPANESDQAVAFDIGVDQPALFAELPTIDAGGTLRFRPADGAEGTATVAVQLVDSGGTQFGGVDRSAIATFTIDIRVRPWQNAVLPVDVNGDGNVTPLDVLTVINELNASGPHALSSGGGVPYFYDVNGDGFLTPTDALQVINYLNSPPQTSAVTSSARTESFAPALALSAPKTESSPPPAKSASEALPAPQNAVAPAQNAVPTAESSLTPAPARSQKNTALPTLDLAFAETAAWLD